MEKMIKSKKGIATLFLLLIIVFVILIVYGLLYLPFFKLQKETVNYILVVIIWIMIQVGLIYGYIQIGRFSIKYFYKFRNSMNKWSLNIKNYVITHY